MKRAILFPGFTWLLGLMLTGLMGAAFAAPDAGVKSDTDKSQSNASKPNTSDSPKARAFKRVEPKALPTLSDDGGLGAQVLLVPIKGTIDPGLVPFIKRGIASHPQVIAVIFEVDTFGGRVDAATEIRDALLSLQIPSVAFINRRAISAGALISLAADYIVFTSGASMGAATPIQIEPGGGAKAVGEKMVSYMRAEMRATAEAKGRSGDLAEAMVDAEVAIDDVIARGKLLTVTTKLAQKLGLANATIETRTELLVALGLGKAEVVEFNENWAEKVARFLTSPAVSGILMMIGMLGLYLELSSPGLGLPGLVAVLALGAFFGGHMIVALAGWEEVALFIFGMGLLALEAFVIPGFGVAGVAGFALLGASLVMAMMNVPLDVAWDAGMITGALTSVMLAFIGSVVLFFMALKYIPNLSIARGLTLETTLGDPVVMGDGAYQSAPTDWTHYEGLTGVAQTVLRPAGKAMIDGNLVDVVSQLDWIEKGTPVRVLLVEGSRIVVIRATPDLEKPESNV